MKKKTLNGILYSAAGSFWWGVLGVLYFKSVAFVSALELALHRTIWTAFLLTVIISFSSKWEEVIKILKIKKKFFFLILSSFLIFANWYTWIYAVTVNKLVDASFGYYIYPILSAFFGIVFLKESYNKIKIISFSLVVLSVIYLLFNFASIPWVGLVVAITWSCYTLVRKKINVSPDLGLFIESAFITPLAFVLFYFIYKSGNNVFGAINLSTDIWLFFAGAMTLIPLYLFLKGTELSGLGPSGMIFFITPTGQFILGIFYFGETLDTNKLVSFLIIWFAVAIYLRELAKDK